MGRERASRIREFRRLINTAQLLADLTRQLNRLEADLRARVTEVPELKNGLAAEWQAARNAERTAETFASWTDQVITQAGVHWLLSCVFLRFIEDNLLVERPWISGTYESGRLVLAQDRHEAYFRAHPLQSDRDYLLAAFREAGALPGLKTFFDEAHNPVFRLGISGDAAMLLRQFWQQRDPNTGVLRHDFTDAEMNTRFLGDLYEDMSEVAKKRYALLQTPEFVEAFILDRTLMPAIREFGFREIRLLDPTCGSGHFLLGAFQRLVDEWARNEPGRNVRDVAQKALDAVAGVDLNPFAVAIARFRLLVAALKASSVRRLADAPNFGINVAIGDSLLHGSRFGLTKSEPMFEAGEHYAGTGLAHAYASEDLSKVQEILRRQYHVVVGNPPYIAVKDQALNHAYRQRYVSCHMKYSLGAPFTERFFELALTGNGRPAGYVGLITANSFMKREFGSKLIEEVLPRLDLTHVVDTSGAYIPGHGTPTVILFGRHRTPVSDVVRTVMGIKGEPSAPSDPAHGLVWSAIKDQIDRVSSASEFVSVGDTLRATFSKHPWSVGGGGATDLKELIESGAQGPLSSVVADMGVFGMTNADESMLASASAFVRASVEAEFRRPLVVGDMLRDWAIATAGEVLFPYDKVDSIELDVAPSLARWLWSTRTVLGNRATFGKSTYFEEKRPWWAWHQVALRRLDPPLTITFAEIATHNHFVLDRGGKVFKHSAPVIKLPTGSSEDEHLGLIGLLNSSVACFWLKQVCQDKAGSGIGRGVQNEAWEARFAFNSTNVAEFPLASERPQVVARQIDRIAREIAALLPAALLGASDNSNQSLPTRPSLDAARKRVESLRRRQFALQETLDWQCYQLYGLLPKELDVAGVDQDAGIEVDLGERAFEIVLARHVAHGRETTTWFERHGSAPVTEIPARWPAAYRALVQRRIDLIESDRNIGLIERPEYKRRWSTPTWNELERQALQLWLLNRMEAPSLWPASQEYPPMLSSVNRFADKLREDAGFMQVAALYAGRDDFDLAAVVADLVTAESVPFLPVLRYKESGLRKRAQWETTWELQRREDAGERVGSIPVPPDYKSSDFLKPDYWRLRGGLDVPKERWTSYPGCDRGVDGSLPIAWAGWNHLQLATALSSYYFAMKDAEGWEPARLCLLLAGLLELVPWLKQWHNELNAEYGERMGDYYEGFVRDEARGLGVTLEELKALKPEVAATRRRQTRVVGQ